MKERYHQGMGSPLRVRIVPGDRRVWPTAGVAER